MAPSPASVRTPLLVCVALVSLGGLTAEVAHEAMRPEAPGWVPLLSLSYEQNLPTWVASSLLLLCALALTRAALAPARADQTQSFHWWGLAAIFFWLSFDEFAEVHEHLGGLVPGAGAFYFSWIIPAGVAVALVGAAYLPFLWRLPARERERFLIAGVLYVTGALLMEVPLGLWTERAGTDNLMYALIDWAEETLELTGAALFLLALVEYAWPPEPTRA